MSTKNNKVSKLVIKACSDNKFSSFTGEFITSINPENLVIKSAVSYHVPDGMSHASLLKYRGSPPKLLFFSLLFDNTGIIPGSNAIAVMEQVKQLQDVAYSIQKKNNAPNYIRVIWGQIDFKGRLQDLDIVYSMFQVDGTLVRAEAHISVLEELPPVGKGKSGAGVDSEYAKASGADATSNRKASASQGPTHRSDAPPSYEEAIARPSGQESFAPTPNGMNGAYSGAPPGAYDGKPDQVYHGSNGAGGAVYASSNVGPTDSSKPASRVKRDAALDGNPNSGPGHDSDHSKSSLKGGVAGNGPGGSGPGVGGGGHGPGGAPKKSGPATTPHGAGSPANKSGAPGKTPAAAGGSAGSAKNSVATDSGTAKGKSGLSKTGGIAAAGVAGSAAAAAAAAGGADSLRKLKANVNLMQKMKEKASFWRRLQKFAKKVLPKKIYEAGKSVGKKI